MSPAIQNVLDRLPDHKRRGNGWRATCPAHDDANPSPDSGDGASGWEWGLEDRATREQTMHAQNLRRVFLRRGRIPRSLLDR